MKQGLSDSSEENSPPQLAYSDDAAYSNDADATDSPEEAATHSGDGQIPMHKSARKKSKQLRIENSQK